jgi:D-alanine-D-alanine ligase
VRIGIAFDVKFSSVQDDRFAELADDPSAAVPFGLAGDEHEEFDSPQTILALESVLRELGHEVLLLGDGEQLLRRLLDGPRPDLVLNIAEGSGTSRTREARVPAVLEMLGIPYTGSDPLTLAVTLDKECAKRLVRDSGLATPAWVLVDGQNDDWEQALVDFPLPAIVKPAFEGSSKGVLEAHVFDDLGELREAIARLREAYRQPILIEEFIEGDELTVGVVGNDPPEVLGIMRVLPKLRSERFVYSLEVKRDWENRVSYECPARLSPADTAAVNQAAFACWRALGCRDVSRIDFRLRNHVPYFLEVNPLPGLSPISGDLVLLAGFMGTDYRELIARILRSACERTASSQRTAEERLSVGAGR